jgi:integrase
MLQRIQSKQGPRRPVVECNHIGHISTHTMRHTYRAWLDAAGTKLSVQQKLMRHADIRTTMNTYGDVVTTETQEAASKVAGLALNGL